jgi:hypothetical protein
MSLLFMQTLQTGVKIVSFINLKTEKIMHKPALAIACFLWATANVHATGLATCDSGPKSGWQPVEKLEQQLKDKGERAELYFHPVTLAPVPIKAR